MPSISPERMAEIWMQPYCVYRHWDSAGRLLYVGCTNNPERRWAGHRTDSKHWSYDVAASQVTWYPTRGLAFIAEWVAIDTEQPLHNANDHLRTRASVGRYAMPVLLS